MVVDNTSKFGTLILMTNPYLITNEKVAIQVGRTVVTFVMKNSSNLLDAKAGKLKPKLVIKPLQKPGEDKAKSSNEPEDYDKDLDELNNSWNENEES